MSFFASGNQAIESTAKGVQVTLSTGSLLAEVDVNGTNASLYPGGQVWGVTWIVGSTVSGAVFLLDHALSTGVASTGIVNQTVVSLTANTGQFFTKHTLESSQAGLQGHRFRVRLATSIVSAHAKIIAEPLA